MALHSRSPTRCQLLLLLLFGQLGSLAIGQEVDSRRTLLTLPLADYELLSEISILSPIPLTGTWIGGHTMRLGAELAMDIINSQQLLLPGYRLNSTWIDDKCDEDYAPKLMLQEWNSGEYAGLGGNGCSAVCRATALLTPSIKMPYISYGCASAVLADTTTFPDFARFMGDESAAYQTFKILGKLWNWTKIAVITGDSSRFNEPAGLLVDAFAGDAIEVDWLVPRDPDYEELLDLMADIKTSFQRAIVVLGYEAFYRQTICASMVNGIPHGVVWLSLGWHQSTLWTTEDEDLLALEPGCTAAAITQYLDGAIHPSGSGTPLASAMEDPLDCLQGYTSESFRELFDKHALDLGYPIGQNQIPGVAYAEIVAYGADGICTWAYLMREMILNRKYTLENVSRPTQVLYKEMVEFVKTNLTFWGVSGKVYWDGNNKPGIVNVNQVQDGTLTTVATVDLEGTMKVLDGMSFRWGDGDTAPGSSFAGCDPGSTLGIDGHCTPCPAGTYHYELLDACISCSVGYYNPSEGGVGQVACRKCSDGTVSTSIGSIECVSCPAGSFSNSQEGNGAYCVECPIGRHQASSGSMECERCAKGSYQAATGQLSCISCPDGRTTEFQASDELEDCRCAEGSYEPYPVAAGSYTCTGCPEGMTCPEGSKLSDWYTELAGNSTDKVYPLLIEQYFSKADDPVFVYKCLDASDCPGGDPGTCASRREGIACGRCFKEFYSFGGKCHPCSDVELTSWVFPTLPCIFGPVVAAFIYTRLLEPFNTAAIDGPKNRAISLFFFFLVHFQTLGIIRQFNIQFPELVALHWEGVGMVNSGVQFLRPECAGGGSFSSFSTQFAFRTALPLFVGLLFVGNYIVFNYIVRPICHNIELLPEKSIFRIGMDKDFAFNAFGTVMYTFSIAVLAIAFDLFKCFPHPNGMASLRVSPDVMCYSSEWDGMIVVGIMGILVYFVFSFSVFQWVCQRAPEQFAKRAFRRRWKFLLVKWTPTCWWFGQVYLMKGLFLNLTLILFASGALQVMWVALTLMIYIVCVMAWRPWRHTIANVMDSVVTMSLLSIALVTIYYTGRNNDADSSLDKVLALLTFFPLLVICCTVSAFLYIWWNYPESELYNGLAATIHIERLLVEVSSPGPQRLLHGLINTPEKERTELLHAFKVLLRESTGTQLHVGPKRLLQRSGTASGELLKETYDRDVGYWHNLLVQHFRSLSLEEQEEEAKDLFKTNTPLPRAEFEMRFRDVLARAPATKRIDGPHIEPVAKYAALALDPYGEKKIWPVSYQAYADKMRGARVSLAGMAFEVEL